MKPKIQPRNCKNSLNKFLKYFVIRMRFLRFKYFFRQLFLLILKLEMKTKIIPTALNYFRIKRPVYFALSPFARLRSVACTLPPPAKFRVSDCLAVVKFSQVRTTRAVSAGRRSSNSQEETSPKHSTVTLVASCVLNFNFFLYIKSSSFSPN